MVITPKSIKRNAIAIELGVMVFAIALMLWVMVPQFLGSQKLNDEEHFPDKNFRYVVAKALAGKPNERFTVGQVEEFDGTLRYLRVVSGVWDKKELSHARRFFKSVKGIGFLMNLTVLEINVFGMNQIDLSKNKQLKSVILRGHYFDNPEIILPEGVEVNIHDLRMSKEEYKKQSFDTLKEHRNLIGKPNALKQFRNLIGNPIALTKEDVDVFEKSTMEHLKELGLIEN